MLQQQNFLFTSDNISIVAIVANYYNVTLNTEVVVCLDT